MPHNIRTVISWLFRWGEHAKFATEIWKFFAEYFGLPKMLISFEAGLLAALATWPETKIVSPFWFVVAGFAVTLVIINAGWSLINKWRNPRHKILPTATARSDDASSLIGSFQSQWPLAQAIIDYVALSVAISQHEACLALQRHMLDGRIKARGPLNSTSVAEIDDEFWRFALPDLEGRAHNLSSFDYLPWFEVCAKDVLAIWPANRKATK